MTRSDRITVRGISGFGYHGVLPHERELGQEFLVDVELEVSIAAAAQGDDLSRTVDYGTVASRVHAVITGEPFDLIETVAEQIAHEMCELPGVHAATVSVHKPGAPMPVPVVDVEVSCRRTAWTRAVLGLGSNQGDSVAYLRRALEGLQAHPAVEVVAVSSAYRTAAVGGPEQDDYLNAVAVVRTLLDPQQLLRLCHEVEQLSGRTREVRWGPRTLDIDILDFGGRQIVSEELVVPHPRASLRAFVLVPWSEIGAEDTLGGDGPTVSDLRDSLDLGLDPVSRTTDVLWEPIG